MNIKKNVLIASVVYIAYVVGLLLISGNCHDNWCRIQEDGPFGFILFSFAPLLVVFFLSLLTYRLRDEVFHAWWSFARWWVLVIVVVTLFFQNASGGGTLGMNQDFTAFTLIILYSILVIVSLTKIVRTYIRTNKKNS